MASRLQILAFAGLYTAMLTTPLTWRLVRAQWGPKESAAQSYLPAFEPPRERKPFNPDPIGDLHGMKPGYVLIGDSMAGRIDFARLRELGGLPVAPILYNATGSAHWFLVFKNYVVASRITPKWVIVFFRDTNLTDPMFRLSTIGLDEVALDREDELNAIVAARAQGALFSAQANIDTWFPAHALVDRVYGVERTRSWLEPATKTMVARLVAGRRRRTFLNEMNAVFELDRLRPLPEADIGTASDRDADFRSNVAASTLPLFLRLASHNRLRLGFVRVLRRPHDGQPPDQSPALIRYVRDLREYVEAHDAVLLDDRDVPELAQIVYADGDHIARDERRRYTDIFYARLSALAR